MEAKKIALLGSTGSIGQNCLKVACHLKGKVKVVALAAKSRIDLLEAQARQFLPKLIAVYDREKAFELAKRLPPGIRVVAGSDGLNEVAAFEEATHVVSAMSGSVGILPTALALRRKKVLLLANKEVLVAAGACLMQLAQENKTPVIPIDSEHSALFQCLQKEEKSAVHRLILTASGGPFFSLSAENLKSITVEEALAHPTWKMGPKVSVDCSTLMNKGLEVIEAHFLFGIPPDRIEVVIHPQSVIHGLVQFVDGSTLAQLSSPHMIYPIQYALTYPERHPALLPHLDLTRLSSLNFSSPDKDRFPCLGLALQALRLGGSMPCFLNGANDALVHRFLLKEISWQEIGKKLETLLQRHTPEKELTIEKVLAIDEQAREEALRI